ncbi:MAG: Extradiol ring-cleavage dioxygenase, class III enzyme, subunit B [Candidatus Moranbacteria bacterium GW2011_GWE2_47_10]|nr:MAG: Extradiol ring-cleavage dioxygenase, class III enzyme, subunit B [Candidatus Moranbacteria bacterium GW2011_GWE2_47_10]
MIVFASIVPHPPFGVPGIGTAEDKAGIKKTLEAFEEIRDGLERANPDTVVVISPHGQMEEFNFVINSDPNPRGSFAEFGLDEVLEFENDLEIVNGIKYCCEMIELPAHLHAHFLDYGALVPLKLLLKNIKPHVVHLSFAMLDYDRHYEYGELMSNPLRNSKKRIAIIASGELSHRLTPEAPAGFSPRAKFFDHWIIEYLANNDIKALTGMEKEAVEDAAECGLRSILIMLGSVYQEKYGFNLVSYESTLGVGYLVARFL